MAEDQDRGDSFEDLFEDLDRFFAPGDAGEEARQIGRASCRERV